jgi:integrase
MAEPTSSTTPTPAAPLVARNGGLVAGMRDAVALASLGLAVPGPTPPADEEALFEQALARGERNKKTTDEYRRHFNEYRAWLADQCGGKTAMQADEDDARAFLKYMQSPARVAPGPDKKKTMRAHPLSASKMRSVRAALNCFYKHCQKKQYRYDNPVEDVKVKRPKPKQGLVLSEEEVRKILNAPGDYPRCEAQAYLLHYSGARTGSLRALLWQHVDFANEVIYFDTAKGDKAYSIAMHLQLKAALLRWRIRQQEEAADNLLVAAALADPDTAYVLLTREGKPLSHSTIAKQYKWRAKRAGVRPHSPNAIVGRENTSKVSPHAARRTAGTTMRRNGADFVDIGDFLNHSDLQVTRESYAFTSTPQKKAVVAKLKF